MFAHSENKNSDCAAGTITIRHLVFVKMGLGKTLSFGIHAQGGMWDGQQALLGNELTGGPADAVSFVVDAQQGTFKVLDMATLANGEGV